MTCARYGVRPGTELWWPSVSCTGWASYWCRRCVLTEQLAEARRLAALVPQLEQQLAALGDGE